MKSKKKNQRKWESNHYQNQEEYNLSKKDKEYLSKYRKIAGEYLEDKELIELFKKNNYDEEEISKELNKIILGDDYKWKEIKNGKPVTTRSTDQIKIQIIHQEIHIFHKIKQNKIKQIKNI